MNSAVVYDDASWSQPRSAGTQSRDTVKCCVLTCEMLVANVMSE